MDDWPVTMLDGSAIIETVAAPEPPGPDTLAAVERVWAAAITTNPSLFNGRIFSADRIEFGRIVGYWTEYRFALARIRLRLPALRAVLRVRPLAVNGVLRTADGIVVGRRNANAIYQAGLWQCAPAGSVEARDDDRVDLVGQVAAELEEELGVPADQCEIGTPLAAVSHPGSGVIDIAIPIRTALSFDAVRACHAAAGNAEYETLAVLGDEAVETWVVERGELVAPPTRILLRLAALTPRTVEGSPR